MHVRFLKGRSLPKTSSRSILIEEATGTVEATVTAGFLYIRNC